MGVDLKSYYAKRRSKMTMILIGFLIGLAVLAIFSLSQSTFPTTFLQAWEVVYNRIMGIKPVEYMDVMRDYIIFDKYIPRIICAICIGAGLAVCGAVMQSITHNPLTDPYTMGLSSASLLGVIIAIILEVSIIPGLVGDTATIANAFIFTMIPAAVIIFMSTFKKINSTMMVLIGVGIMYIFNSAAVFIKINAEPEKLEEAYRWSVGTLSMTDWDSVAPVVIVTVITVVLFTLLAKQINIITTGDKTSQSLGVNPFRLRSICLIIISVLVATAVSFTGTIGFVGLVIPHITRLFTGNNNKLLIPFSAVLGAIMLLAADTIVRMLPYGLPAGVITALVGSPLFIYFLYRQRKVETF